MMMKIRDRILMIISNHLFVILILLNYFKSLLDTSWWVVVLIEYFVGLSI